MATQKTAALKVPILPQTSPEAPQPKSLKMPLYPHQLRALHRCMLIETDGSLQRDFGAMHAYSSRGGCLADAVGMGKTATSIGLILSSPRERGEGDTLVVAPGHLIHQWKAEIEKFTDDIEVLVGRKEYERRATLPPEGKSHRVVLMNVDDIITEEKLWYNFRRVFSSENGYQVKVDSQTMEEYKNAALFCVKSPRGPCSYEGWVFTGPLHLPFRPWRRVIFDEIQDLVAEGTESQKNLLQLSRTAKNVWLLSATPFPHGNDSVYANHELLGFCRLRMNVETDYELGSNHPFEIIKRKLYIRSPKHVADTAVTASQKVTSDTIYIDATELEKKFFELEQNDLVSRELFSEEYDSLRQMINHPEASKKLREQINGRDEDFRGGRTGKAVQLLNRTVGRFATINSFAKRSLETARSRFRTLEYEDIPASQNDIELVRSSWYLALKIRQVRSQAITANPFALNGSSPSINLEAEEAKAIHQYYCRCPHYGSSSCEADGKARFQTLARGESTPSTVFEGYKAVERIIDYFKNEVRPGRKILYQINSREEEDYLECVIKRKESVYKSSSTRLETLEAEKLNLQTRIKALEETVKVGNTTKGMSEEEELAARNGSKMAVLIQLLRQIEKTGEKTIVFSYWHDVLNFVQRSLRNNGLISAFCNGRTGNLMAKSIASFTTGDVPILLLSASAKASGANLQQASNVILLDPAGSSSEHGATLEQQAIGRAVRMGQEKAVRVVRFCVRDTVEEELYDAIDLAAAKLVTRQNDNNYTCESAHKSLDKEVLQKKKAVEDDDDVCMMGSVTAKQRVARQRAQAVANNEVIVIDDSDDEEEEDSKPKALPTVKAPVANTKVKSEPTANVAPKRTSEEIGETEPSSASDKRAKVTEMATTQAARRVSSNPSPNQDMVPAVSNEEETTSNSNLVSQRRGVNKDVYLVDTGGKLHSLEAEQKVKETARVEYLKVCNMESCQFSQNDKKWLDKWMELKQLQDASGTAWMPGQKDPLGKWCKYQRDQMKKNMKGQHTTLSEGRIKMLDDLQFLWGSDITPTKQSATTLQSSSSNVVSPQEVEDASRFEELVGNKTTSPLKDSTSQDGRITVSVVKPTRDTKLGLSVAHVSDDTQSSSLLKVTCVSGSLFDGSSLKEGMIVDTVNGVTYATYKEVLAALQNAEGQMTVTTKPRSIEDVTPAVQPLMPTPVDGLKDLLSICDLSQYLDKFKEAGISSADGLKSKLKDISFMEKLVDATGMKASEAIRLMSV